MIPAGFEGVVTVRTEVHREGNSWLAECPGLEVEGSGVTETEARAMLWKALAGFFKRCAETGSLDDVVRKNGVISAFPVTSADRADSASTLDSSGWERVPVRNRLGTPAAKSPGSHSGETPLERRRRLLHKVTRDFKRRGIGLDMAENLPRSELYDRDRARAEAAGTDSPNEGATSA
ncbi:MAG: hypothetical protein OXU63_00085 [Acidobacteriota bacterium]|nr:hypothetical protein [Acidobacteriota bacterium]